MPSRADHSYATDGMEYLAFLQSNSGLLTREFLTPFLSEIVAPKGKRILDLGCGEGYYVRFFKDRGAKEVHGIDISPDLLEAAKKQDPEGKYFLVNFETEKFGAGEQYDIVLANMVLMNLPDLDEAYKKIASALAPGGRLVIAIASPYYARPVGTWKRSILGKIRLLIDNYFEPRANYFSFPDSNKKFPHYHRGLSAYINSAHAAGFTLLKMHEPGLSAELSEKYRGTLLARQLSQVPIFQILNFKYGK